MAGLEAVRFLRKLRTATSILARTWRPLQEKLRANKAYNDEEDEEERRSWSANLRRRKDFGGAEPLIGVEKRWFEEIRLHFHANGGSIRTDADFIVARGGKHPLARIHTDPDLPSSNPNNRTRTRTRLRHYQDPFCHYKERYNLIDIT